jgi:hypothetical protein
MLASATFSSFTVFIWSLHGWFNFSLLHKTVLSVCCYKFSISCLDSVLTLFTSHFLQRVLENCEYSVCHNTHFIQHGRLCFLIFTPITNKLLNNIVTCTGVHATKIRVPDWMIGFIDYPLYNCT